jgi:hypothetical protein
MERYISESKKTPQNEHFGEMLFICNFKFEPPAAGIEEACPQGRKGIGPRGAEATLGAPVPRWGLGLHPRTTGESPKTRPKNTNFKNPFGFN